MAEDLNEQFIKYLRDNSYLVTRQRKRIAEILFNTAGHLSVEDIQTLLRQKEKSASKKISASIASIYRTLEVLIKSNLVVQHRFGKRFKRFEAVRQDKHHDHLVCLHCGKVLEFKNDIIENLQIEVAREHNFNIINHKLDIYGFCSKCKSRT